MNQRQRKRFLDFHLSALAVRRHQADAVRAQVVVDFNRARANAIDPDNLTGKYILGDDHVARPCRDLFQWAEWFEQADRHVAVDLVAGYRISTVFLGIDHSYSLFSPSHTPILFETMVFAPELKTFDLNGHPHQYHDDLGQWRYSTWDQAQAGHATVKHWLEQQLESGAPEFDRELLNRQMDRIGEHDED